METARPDQQDEVSRFWREEREEGAVYNAYLKKVTYLSQARLEDENEKKQEFSHLMWETHKVRVIRAGTLEKLVESLTNIRGEMDSSYVNVFLATYRTFATPKQVLQTVIDRYKAILNPTKEDKSELRELQIGALNSVLLMWLESYVEDFRDSPDYTCLHVLDKFAHEHVSGSGLGRKIQEKLQAFKSEDAELEASKNEFQFSLRDGGSHPADTDCSKSLALLEISCRKIAEQLTCKDADLFRKVVPHHCLGAVWSRRRDKEGSPEAPSIQATIQQFNRISLRVIASILRTQELKASHRAKVIQKWIKIAQDLRELKNFSSLKAIITGLQSHAVYRLRKTWSAVPKDAVVLFEELSEIFSVENNQINSRELLMKEATAKFPDLDFQSKSLKRKNMQKRRSWIDNGIVQGTVPYLGTFLTDLTMIDTAMPDTTDDSLINFEKRRKEFEVLAQLKLLQSAASIYTITQDDCFWRWFNSIRVFSDSDSHELSCSIEPVSETAAKIKKKSARFDIVLDCMRCFKKFCLEGDLDYIGLRSALRANERINWALFINGTPLKRRLSASTLYACFACSSRFSEPILSNSDLDRRPRKRTESTGGLGTKSSKDVAARMGLLSCGLEDGASNSIASIPDTVTASISPLVFKPSQHASMKNELSHSSSTSSVISSDSDPGPGHTPFKSCDSYVIKVSMSSSHNDIAHVYKSIMLMNSDHTHTVIEKILEKYGHEGTDPHHFCLIQVLPDGELLIPDRANVFYAINNSVELKFVLKTREEYKNAKDKQKGRRRRLKKPLV